jgi:hypothetical protein
MRHVLLPRAIAAGTRCMVHAPAAARLIASASGALRLAPRVSCTTASTVDLTAVAAAADQHLSPAAHAHKQPPRCFQPRAFARAWTTSAMSGIVPRHACSARCGARRRSGLGGFRSTPCPSIRQVVTAPSVRSSPRHGLHPTARREPPVDMWTTQARCPHTHRPSNSRQYQFDDCRTAGLTPACLTTAKCHVRPSVTSSRRHSAIFMRILTAVHINGWPVAR